MAPFRHEFGRVLLFFRLANNDDAGAICSSSKPHFNGFSGKLAFRRRAKVLSAERFHISVAQAIQRQTCQVEFFRKRPKDRSAIGAGALKKACVESLAPRLPTSLLADFCYDFSSFGGAFGRKPLIINKKWLGAESNRRHEDFQSSALPTELPSLNDLW
jgi:hypothetical protein